MTVSPSQLIVDLDAALAEAGETITLRRLTLGPAGVMIPFDAEDVPASIRPLRAEELVGTIDQTWSRVVLSPTALYRFPLPVKKGDKVVQGGKARNVEVAKPINVQNVLVRIDLMVSG